MKEKYVPKNINPEILLIPLYFKRNTNNKVIINKYGIIMLYDSFNIDKFENNEEAPATRRIFAIFEPIIFPSAILE